MNKKLLVLIILATMLVLTGGAFLIWQKYHPLNAALNSPSAETKQPEIPKVSEYQVPILMYHYIRDAFGETELGKKLSVSPSNFALQLKWLKENNYETIKISDLADPGKTALSKVYFDKKKPIVLTFDDGYQDAYAQALPILKKYGFIGTFYIIRGYVGGGNYLNQAQIDELANAGMEIGSHSMTHPDLSTVNFDEAKNQILNSKSGAISFCYPSGKYNDQIISLVKEAGYTSATTTHMGVADQNSNLFELPRIRVEDGSGETLKNKIESASQ